MTGSPTGRGRVNRDRPDSPTRLRMIGWPDPVCVSASTDRYRNDGQIDWVRVFSARRTANRVDDLNHSECANEAGSSDHQRGTRPIEKSQLGFQDLASRDPDHLVDPDGVRRPGAERRLRNPEEGSLWFLTVEYAGNTCRRLRRACSRHVLGRSLGRDQETDVVAGGKRLKVCPYVGVTARHRSGHQNHCPPQSPNHPFAPDPVNFFREPRTVRATEEASKQRLRRRFVVKSYARGGDWASSGPTSRSRPTLRLGLQWIFALAVSVTAGTTTSIEAQEEASASVRGIVVGEDATPLEGVEVSALELSVITTREGRFELTKLPTGPVVLHFSHLGLGDHLEAVVLSPGQQMSLEVRMTAEAIELTPFVVEARSDLEERRRFSGHGINEVQEWEIDRAARAGLTLRGLLQTTMPGTLAEQSGLSRTCVQYRAIRSGGDTGCMEVTVILDGVQVASPGYIYETMPLNTISRLEMLSPGQAGVRYGTAAGQAVLVIETRRGPQLRRAADDRLVTGLAWDEDQPYNWTRVLGSIVVVNSATVGSALLLADQCLRSPAAGSLGLRTRCNGFNTAAIGLLSVGVPAVAGALAARWSGGTDRSRGRMGPSAFAGGVVLSSGYLLLVHGGGGARAAGYALLSAGVPFAIALADRVFRTLR